MIVVRDPLSHNQAFALSQDARIPAMRHSCTLFLRCYTSVDLVLETRRAVEPELSFGTEEGMQ